jgi:light-regulated signal transduction histidine kinase (bacteriophytochrome)
MTREHDVVVERASDDESVMDGQPAGIRWAHRADQELRHELRNALTAAIGYTALLRRRSALWTNPRDRRAVEAVHVSLRHASRLVQDGPDAELRESCSLRQLAAGAVTQVPPLRADDIVFNILTEDPLVGRWNAERIVQVLINLLDNAVKYSPAGTPIVVEIEQRSNWGRLVVRDQGIGIEAEDLDAIFQGHRTELARLVSSGSGIGLGLSRRLIEAEGGQLGVSSQAGVGSEFWLDLPLNLPFAPAGHVNPTPGQHALSATAGMGALREEVTAVLAQPFVSVAEVRDGDMADSSLELPDWVRYEAKPVGATGR